MTVDDGPEPRSTYVIRGGVEGRERLRILARVMWPTSNALLSEVGIPPAGKCLDFGCGGGDLTMSLAQQLPNGFVVGIDIDEIELQLARAEAADAGIDNVEFRSGDVMDPYLDAERFDLVYARFLLTHLPHPARAVSNMVARLASGGVLVIEDIDFTGHFCDPPSAAFRRYVDVYTQVLLARRCNPNIGPRLPSLLRAGGLEDVGMSVVQPAGFEGEVKLIGPITLEAIAEAVIGEELLTVDELNRTVDELYTFANTEGTVLSLPRVVQSWGRRSA
jgi:SAM-dependent methyltransferase